ncbi:leucine-rich repeat protein [Skeletonema marinoi]|uniref:Leucine-rich repeat protein n=1 Tax=Skeletonema marinoi TaxID=267567 RepID=A0AAD8Y9R4_9STRA|nr:leucine-rich repeat protein [Skeletonema marinoi]
MSFTNNDSGNNVPAGMSVEAILDIVESNKHLRKLEIESNRIGRDHIEKLCSAVHNHALLELSLFSSFEPGIGNEMLTSLLSIDGLKLEKLDMSSSNITSAVGMLLSDFIETNPRMRELNLRHNDLDDRDAALIANALRSNSTLRNLDLYRNSITEVGAECLRLVLCDESSLNAAADSNHNCNVRVRWDSIDDNSHEQGQINRGRKIYSILSKRNETMSNVQHFGDIDVKILPNILEAVQKYATKVHEDEDNPKPKVKPLSIVYETMRKWEKAFYL